MDAHIALTGFTATEFKEVAAQYLRARFDIERDVLEEQLDSIVGDRGAFTWDQVTALTQLAGAIGWKKYA